MRPQLWHLIVLLVVVLLIFGANKLPDITRNVGRSMKIFKQEVKELRDDVDAVDPNSTTDAPAAPPESQTQSVPTGTQQGSSGTAPGDTPGDANR
ncbi:Sec-independent protein translocase subunit TatA [Occultella gossypii]|uniref:Sec-independent protein translocase protein TatA n=1 Tax=Occultella gossypii TaxID=2800820 RepID=A0ABS7S443_9MICO|nr:Sec-independent protein translocase subunit TatA [Occultella gossypii]MBZ2195120.1 Sec-independent protein translocase subunit TatA [Occultella gossypii]